METKWRQHFIADSTRINILKHFGFTDQFLQTTVQTSQALMVILCLPTTNKLVLQETGKVRNFKVDA